MAILNSNTLNKIYCNREISFWYACIQGNINMMKYMIEVGELHNNKINIYFDNSFIMNTNSTILNITIVKYLNYLGCHNYKTYENNGIIKQRYNYKSYIVKYTHNITIIDKNENCIKYISNNNIIFFKYNKYNKQYIDENYIFWILTYN